MRQDEKKRSLNNLYKAKYKQAIRKIITLAKKKEKPSKKEISQIYSIIDKVAKKKIIHKNKAARLKTKVSKLTK